MDLRKGMAMAPTRLEAECELLLEAKLARRKGIQRHEEIREVAAVAQFILDKNQTLQRDFFRDAIIKSEMMRANVDATIRAEIVVG